MYTLTEKIDSREQATGDSPAVTLHHHLVGAADNPPNCGRFLAEGKYTAAFRRDIGRGAPSL